MPDYEYECQKCGHVTASMRGFTQRDDPCKCECCGSSRTKRYYSPVQHEWPIADGFTQTDLIAAANNEGPFKPQNDDWARKIHERSKQ